MRLVKDNSVGAGAVRVLCIGSDHDNGKLAAPWFTLSQGYADLDGRAFVDYYCDKCVAKMEQN